ncbi:MAG: FISUMP domain-containing protein [Flavobacteriales bacterium]
MRLTLTTLALLFCTLLFAQAPALIPYQAIARDASGQPMASSTLNARFTIHDATATGPNVWQELQTITTSPLGLFTVQLGSSISLAGVNWASGAKFMQVEINVGNGYVDIGTQQMLSVPYALYAGASGSSTPGPIGPAGPAGPQGPTGNGFSNGTATNQLLYWNGSAWVTLNPGSVGQVLTLCSGGLIWTTGGVCPGTVTALNCASATNQGTLTAGTAATGVSSTIAYTGGNGGAYSAQSIASTGITGLAATLTAGSLASGSGSVTYTISGTPSGAGTANFTLSLGEQSCTLAFSVSPAGSGGGNTLHTCGVSNVHNPNLTYGTMTDQEGNVYNTIVIGTQEWMAENLNTSTYRNGDAIPNLSYPSWYTTISGAWAYYNNDSSYACPFGKLYNWYACVDARHLCPVGWHVPTDAEWTVLTNYLGGEAVAGGKMKTIGTIEASNGLWNEPNLGANNSMGFSGLPGGFRFNDAESYDFGNWGYWWSSSANYNGGNVPYGAWTRFLSTNNSVLYKSGTYPLAAGMSVRCLRD